MPVHASSRNSSAHRSFPRSIFSPEPKTDADRVPPSSDVAVSTSPENPEIVYGFRERRDGSLIVMARVRGGRDYTVAELHDQNSDEPFLVARVPLRLTTMERLCELIRGITAAPSSEQYRACVFCGCTNDDCRKCVKRTGKPCHWVAPSLCSACTMEGGAR